MLVVYGGWHHKIGDVVSLDELKRLVAEVTATFDPVPDHYARGVSAYAWPTETLVREIEGSQRLSRLWSKLKVKPFYQCSIRLGILVVDRELRPLACLVPAGYRRPEATAKRLAVIVPATNGDYIVFTAYKPVVPALVQKAICEDLGDGILLCARDPSKILEAYRVPYFRSREAVDLEEYLRGLGVEPA